MKVMESPMRPLTEIIKTDVQYNLDIASLQNTTVGHDKVYFLLLDRDTRQLFRFWGKRGASLSVKEETVSGTVMFDKLVDEKLAKGYRLMELTRSRQHETCIKTMSNITGIPYANLIELLF